MAIFSKAIEVVDSLTQILKAQARVKSVKVLQYPLDVRPEASAPSERQRNERRRARGAGLQNQIGAGGA